MRHKTATPALGARLRRGLTLRQLAAACAAKGVPVDNSQLSKIERGKSTPRPKLRAALAEILELDVADFDTPPVAESEPTEAEAS
jgi:transcriptional regulator with XRE-family HTH domain